MDDVIDISNHRDEGMRRYLSMAILTCIMNQGWAASTADTQSLETMADNGQSQAVYNKFQTTPINPQMDTPTLLGFGIAALNTGHPAEAEQALNWIIAREPNQLRARLEYARALYLLHRYNESKQNFIFVLKNNPPPTVIKNIQPYLLAMNPRNKATQTQHKKQTDWSAYLEYSVGADSNVNGGVDNPNISLPLFGSVTLDDTGVQGRSNFAKAAGGVHWNHPFKKVILLGQANAAGTALEHHHAYSQWSNEFLVGIQYPLKAHQLQLTTSHHNFNLDNTPYWSQDLLNGQWLYARSTNRTFSTNLQYGQTTYSGTNATRNIWQRTATLSWNEKLPWTYQPLLSLSLTRGSETSKMERADLARMLHGGGIQLQVTPQKNWTSSIAWSALKSGYRSPDPLLSLARADRYRSTALALTRTWTSSLNTTLEYTVSHNRSNLALYDFSRNIITLKMHHDFQ